MLETTLGCIKGDAKSDLCDTGASFEIASCRGSFISVQQVHGRQISLSLVHTLAAVRNLGDRPSRHEVKEPQFETCVLEYLEICISSRQQSSWLEDSSSATL